MNLQSGERILNKAISRSRGEKSDDANEDGMIYRKFAGNIASMPI